MIIELTLLVAAVAASGMSVILLALLARRNERLALALQNQIQALGATVAFELQQVETRLKKVEDVLP